MKSYWLLLLIIVTGMFSVFGITEDINLLKYLWLFWTYPASKYIGLLMIKEIKKEKN